MRLGLVGCAEAGPETCGAGRPAPPVKRIVLQVLARAREGQGEQGVMLDGATTGGKQAKHASKAILRKAAAGPALA